MLFLQILALALLVGIPVMSLFLTRLLPLHKLGIRAMDVMVPLFAYAFYWISTQAFYHSLLPELGVAMGGLGLILICFFVIRYRTFYYSKFFKYYWRLSFLLMVFMYLAMIISLFFQAK
ncbi:MULTISPECIES: DUF3397 domain-containing protein [unclassified Streptococcus]|uniref:DUF3397 domain-containing protein n=1 Tax=unclassified Streptococcus TaxID=2608887 RepID=UPI0010728687|nr:MULTISPECIES: DUF3397 domain-containing protein [unclassified Streptococcus]MBF0806215.1 DUF3397 domain-containing protein [Streptococcus sp. 19428wA2_WM07]TFU28198.1 DUF3397 domain-containing protein [Streptococcus sp. WM07]